MCDLATTAERLRTVREAQRRFLAMWAVDCLLEQRTAIQKVADDVARITHAQLSDASGEGWSFTRQDDVFDE